MTKLKRSKFSAAMAGIVMSFGVTHLASQQSPSKVSLVLSASAPESVAVNAELIIGIRITNISGDSLELVVGHHGNLPDGYKYIVRDEKGDLLPEYPLCSRPIPEGALRRPCRAPGNSRRGSLGPGETWTTAAQLTDLYRFSRPGRYTIQVSTKPEGMPIVYSNLLTLTALARPAYHHAYYLFFDGTPRSCEACYVPLLITADSLEEAAKGADKAPCVLITTYERDSIWHNDGIVFLAPGDIEVAPRIVHFKGQQYRYQEIGSGEVLRLLENPMGTIPISRPILPNATVPGPTLKDLISAFRGSK